MSKERIAINSVQIPIDYIKLCRDWHGGLGDCSLYAIASTNGLTLGTNRPYNDGEPMTEEEWYTSLFSNLSSDIGYAIRTAEKIEETNMRGDISRDIDTLRNFEVWADAIREQLADSYGLE